MSVAVLWLIPARAYFVSLKRTCLSLLSETTRFSFGSVASCMSISAAIANEIFWGLRSGRILAPTA